MSAFATLKSALSLGDVAATLGFKASALSYLLYKYQGQKYQTFQIPKRSGGTRTISAPIPQIKLLQRRLSDRLQDCIEEIEKAKSKSKLKGKRRRISHGFTRGSSIMTNARAHRGRRFVFNIDLKDFFPSINFGRVRGFFLKNKDFALTPKAATVLAQIACENGALPQGAPSSPVISNLITHVLDVRLAQLARKHGCTYTRYADDLTFSTNLSFFPPAIATNPDGGHSWIVGVSLAEAVSAAGFSLNDKKTRMQYCDSRQMVTGLVVNRRVNTRSEYRRRIRAMTHRLLTTGKFQVTNQAAVGPAIAPMNGTIHQLQGMYGFIDCVDLFVKKGRGQTTGGLSSIEKSYRRFLMHKDLWASKRPTILCEGKTDNIYLRGAIRSLVNAHPVLASAATGGKIDYRVRLLNYTHTTQRILDMSGGTSIIKKFLLEVYLRSVEKLPRPRNQNALVVVLDNDSGAKEFKALIGSKQKIVCDGMNDFYRLAANVYVVFTPKASVAGESKIEDFFTAVTRAAKLGGKTFNPTNDTDTDTEYGKWAFAKNVVRPHIAKIDFSGFDGLLTRIEKAIDDYENVVASGAP